MITDEIKFKGALKVDVIRVWNSTKTKFKDINEYDFFNEELSKLHQTTVISSVCECEPRTRYEWEKDENECSDCGLHLFKAN